MSILRTVAPTEATGLVAEIYSDDVRDLGYVPSHTLIMALNPEAYVAWEALAKAVAGGMDKRRYELVTLAAARAMKSQSCLIAHGQNSLKYMPEEVIVAAATGTTDPGLTDAEQEMMAFAAKISTDSASITDADNQRLRDLGFSDTDIVQIGLAAAMRNYFSRALHAFATEVDVPPSIDPELRDKLVSAV